MICYLADTHFFLNLFSLSILISFLKKSFPDENKINAKLNDQIIYHTSK